MLEFMFDCIDKYIDRRDYELLETDTDSLYMALSAESLELLVPEDKKEDFFRNYHKWFPAESCPEHRESYVDIKCKGGEWKLEECCEKLKLKNKRTPGLFKTEFDGTFMICLCSKTYICGNDDTGKTKRSTKGLNKRQNPFTKEDFENVLLEQKSSGGVNISMKTNGVTMMTYAQARLGLSYFYGKRRVLEDGVSTEPLDI